jgi:hybrid cluster-associated redox disulfide protein
MAKKKAIKKTKVVKAKKVQKAKKIVNKSVKQKEVKQIITRKMLIGDVAIKYPKAVEIMFKFGMHCIGCGMTAYESIEQGCMAHGMSGEEIDKMVEEMNKAIAK